MAEGVQFLRPFFLIDLHHCFIAVIPRSLRENSKGMNDTVFYIVVFLVIAHFVVGFVFLVRKLSGPVKEDPEKEKEEI